MCIVTMETSSQGHLTEGACGPLVLDHSELAFEVEAWPLPQENLSPPTAGPRRGAGTVSPPFPLLFASCTVCVFLAIMGLTSRSLSSLHIFLFCCEM